MPSAIQELAIPSDASAIIWRSPNFNSLPLEEAALRAVTKTHDDQLPVYALTESHMGREAGWNVVFQDNQGERFTYIGIKGVGLTEAGKNRLLDFTLPQSYDDTISGIPVRNTKDIYDFKCAGRFLAPQNPGLDVLGFVDTKEIKKDHDLTLRMASEGFLTSEPVALVQGDRNDPVVHALNNKGFFKTGNGFWGEKNTTEIVLDGREARAFRIPRRLITLDLLIENNDVAGIMQELDYAVSRCTLLRVPLSAYGGSNDYENYLIWLYQNAGKQAGIAARVNFEKAGLSGLGDITYAMEIVDLGQNAGINEAKDMRSQEFYKNQGYSSKASDANEIYQKYATLPFVVFAALKKAELVKEEMLPLIKKMAHAYHENFKQEYQKNPEDWRQLREILSSNNYILWRDWFLPHMAMGKPWIQSMLGMNKADAVMHEGHFADHTLATVEWPMGRPVQIIHYSNLLAFALSREWLKDVSPPYEKTVAGA